MEGLIIFIVVAVISSILGKNKDAKKQSEQMPTFNPNAKQASAEPQRTRSKKERPTIQSFEELAKEFLHEVKDSLEQSKPEVKPVVTEASEVQRMSTPRESMESRLENRKNAEGRVNHETKRPTKGNDFITPVIKSSPKALVQAVVMAEMLGPPKAKQSIHRHSR